MTNRDAAYDWFWRQFRKYIDIYRRNQARTVFDWIAEYNALQPDQPITAIITDADIDRRLQSIIVHEEELRCELINDLAIEYALYTLLRKRIELVGEVLL